MAAITSIKEQAISSLLRLLGSYEPVHKFIPGILGDPVGVVEIPGRSGYVNVRLLGESKRYVRALNMGVLPLVDTNVWVEMTGSPGSRERYRVIMVNNAGMALTGSLDIHADTMRLRETKTPVSAADTGSVGDICWDATYLYVCVATDTWKRVELVTWP